MALKVIHKPEFKATVNIDVPAAQGSLDVTFIGLPHDELTKAEEEDVRAGTAPYGVLAKVMREFEPFALPGGEQVKTVDNWRQVPGLAPAVMNAYWTHLMRNRAKN